MQDAYGIATGDYSRSEYEATDSHHLRTSLSLPQLTVSEISWKRRPLESISIVFVLAGTIVAAHGCVQGLTWHKWVGILATSSRRPTMLTNKLECSLFGRVGRRWVSARMSTNDHFYGQLLAQQRCRKKYVNTSNICNVFGYDTAIKWIRKVHFDTVRTYYLSTVCT
jgi:hypothetical protein